MTFWYRNHMGKDTNLLFTVHVVMQFWVLGEHNTLIIALFIYVGSWRSWRGTWTIKGGEGLYAKVRALEREYKQVWDNLGPVMIEVNLCEDPEKSSARCGDILRKLLHWMREIPFMSNDLVWGLLHWSYKAWFTKGRERSGRILGRGNRNKMLEGNIRGSSANWLPVWPVPLLEHKSKLLGY